MMQPPDPISLPAASGKGTPFLPSRREFLWNAGGGLGGIALTSLLGRENLLASAPPSGGVLHAPHHPAKARRVVQLFMAGAASHIDLFDYKPELIRRHGKKSDFGEPVETFQDGLGPWMKPVWDFKPYGQCGKPLGEVVAPLGKVVDEMAFVHNMVGKTGVHSQATYLQATGFQLPGFPGMGSWISYGLGSRNDNLPTFVVLPDHRGFASNGPINWGSAFLPAQHQGTIIRPGTPNPIADLFPRAGNVKPESERDGLRLLDRLNRLHETAHPGDSRLEARIRSYELAARMQLAAPEALDLSKEPTHILKLYGLDRPQTQWAGEINAPEEIDYFGRKCLVARRLLERGVRFVQVWSGCDNGLGVLDEPFSGLDPLVRAEFIEGMLELTEQEKWTIFLSSHDIDEVERLADTVGIVNDGRLVLAEGIESLQALPDDGGGDRPRAPVARRAARGLASSEVRAA